MKGLAADGGLFLPEEIPEVKDWVRVRHIKISIAQHNCISDERADGRTLAELEGLILLRPGFPDSQLVYIAP